MTYAEQQADRITSEIAQLLAHMTRYMGQWHNETMDDASRSRPDYYRLCDILDDEGVHTIGMLQQQLLTLARVIEAQ